MKRIEIRVSPEGQTQVETKGFTGPECQQASRFLEEALGQKQSEQLTPEFHLPASQDHHTRENQ